MRCPMVVKKAAERNMKNLRVAYNVALQHHIGTFNASSVARGKKARARLHNVDKIPNPLQNRIIEIYEPGRKKRFLRKAISEKKGLRYYSAYYNKDRQELKGQVPALLLRELKK